MKHPFKFNYRRRNTCKECGKIVPMLPRQKTCDECREKLGKKKLYVPTIRYQ